MKNINYYFIVVVSLLVIMFIKTGVVVYADELDRIERGKSIASFNSIEEAYLNVLSDDTGNYTDRIYQTESLKYNNVDLQLEYRMYKNKKSDRFCLCDLNSDGIKELLTFYDVYDGRSDVYVYTYKGEKLYYIGFMYEYHKSLRFNKNTKIAVAGAVYRGDAQYGYVFDGNAIERKYWSDKYHDEFYEVEGKEVTAREYEEYTSTYLDLNYNEENELEQIENNKMNQDTFFKVSEKSEEEKENGVTGEIKVLEPSEKQTVQEKVLADFALSSLIYNLNPMSEMYAETNEVYTFYYYINNKNPKILKLYPNIKTDNVLFQVKDNNGKKLDIIAKMFYDSYIKNYQFIAYGMANSCGMQSAAFLTPENEIVIVFRGTNQSVDWLTDISMAMKQNIEQYTYAERFYQDVYKKYVNGTNRTVRLTGHSLGGALAAYVSMRHDLPAICINDASGFVIDSAYGSDAFAVEKFEGAMNWKYHCYINADNSAFNNAVTGNFFNIQSREYRKMLKINGNGYMDFGDNFNNSISKEDQKNINAYITGRIINPSFPAIGSVLVDVSEAVQKEVDKQMYAHSIASLLRVEVVDSTVIFSLPSCNIEQQDKNALAFGNLILGTVGDDTLNYQAGDKAVTVYTGSGKDIIHGTKYNDTIIASAEGEKLFFGGDGNDTYIIDSIYVKNDIHINDTLGNNRLHIKNIDIMKLDIQQSKDDYYFKLNGGIVYINRDFQKNSKCYLTDGTNQIELNKLNNFDIKRISFLFGNTPKAFGYPEKDHRFSLDVYKTVYGDTKQAKEMYENQVAWHGSCFGIVAASMLLYEKNNGYSVSDFGSDYKMMYDLNAHIKNKNGYSVRQFIEYMQVLQSNEELHMKKEKTKNSIKTILQKIRDFELNDSNPIILFLTKTDGSVGHALFPYRVVWEGEEKAKVYIYDCNYPGDNTRIIDFDGNNWSFLFSTSKTGSNIYWGNKDYSLSYLEFSDVYAKWCNMGKRPSNGLLMLQNVDNATISDANGKVAVNIINNTVVNESDSIVWINDAAVTETIEKSINLWVPAGKYMITNTGTGKNMKVVMADGNSVAKIETTCKSVLVYANDSKDKPFVSVPEGEVGTYKITLENQKEIKTEENIVNKEGITFNMEEKSLTDNLLETEENNLQENKKENASDTTLNKESATELKDYDKFEKDGNSTIPNTNIVSKKLKIKKFIVKAKRGKNYIVIKSSVPKINITVKHKSRKYKKTIKRFIPKKKNYYYLRRKLKKGDQVKVTVRKAGYKTKTKKIKVK